ncbi:MAG: hypothetical protein JW940_35200 [Polyangiaceae bacterium]|nr:hypothetical protein [Polyangiaceae bacterium]
MACIGPEGCSGYQVCRDDGERFDPCICEGATAATGGGATLATGGLSGGGRAGLPSGGSSAAGGQSVASGGSSAGGSTETKATGGAAVDCEPAEMNDWAAPAYVPARAPQDLCSEALIRQYSADCLDSADCASFEAGGEYAECGECLRPTPADDAEYGPLILSGILRETNFAGCIELVGEAGCAVHQQHKSRCEHEACYANCPVADTDSLTEYQECKQQARSGVCSAYREAAVCIVDPAHVEACGGDDFEESFVSVGMVFCGGLASELSGGS